MRCKINSRVFIMRLVNSCTTRQQHNIRILVKMLGKECLISLWKKKKHQKAYSKYTIFFECGKWVEWMKMCSCTKFVLWMSNYDEFLWIQLISIFFIYIIFCFVFYSWRWIGIGKNKQSSCHSEWETWRFGAVTSSRRRCCYRWCAYVFRQPLWMQWRLAGAIVGTCCCRSDSVII